MQYRKTGLTSVLLLIALPGLNNLSYNPVRDDAEHVQRAIQLAHERELVGSDTIRIGASALRRTGAHIHDFVREYSARSLKTEWKNEAETVARAIVDSSIRYGLDPILLLAVIQNESRFDPAVVGSHGEIGLMQIKPDTAAWVAKKAHIRWRGAEMLRDPASNIRIGAAYLSMLRSKFSYEKDLYLAAYNMGVRNLNRLLGSNGYPQIYPKKTIQHYSRIYLEFLDAQAQKPAASLAAI